MKVSLLQLKDFEACTPDTLCPEEELKQRLKEVKDWFGTGDATPEVMCCKRRGVQNVNRIQHP